MSSIRTRVLLFAGLAQAAGRREIEVELPDGATARELRDAVARAYPALSAPLARAAVAVNQRFAEADERLSAGDEVALIPPVSGGSQTAGGLDGGGTEPVAWADSDARFRVTTESLSVERLERMVVDPHKGAVVLFSGTVREFTYGKRTVRLEYESYPEMAVRMLRQIGDEIAERWPGAVTAIHHRVGKLEISEISVVIAVASAHRAYAFEACRYAIERIKEIVPIWKKEVWEDGEEWIGSQTGPWKP